MTSERFLALESLQPEGIAKAGAIDGHRLLDEGIDPFLDGIRHVEGPEVGRGGEDDQVDLVDDLLVRIEAGVLAILGNVNTRANRPRRLELRKAVFKQVREGVGHRDQLDAGVGLEGLPGGPGASAAAADQTNLDRAAAGCVDQGNGQPGRDAIAAAAPDTVDVEFLRKSRRVADIDESARLAGGLRLRSVSHGRGSS